MPLPASQPVVTQLTIDASGAAAGAAQYDAAMAKAEAAANKLTSANDNLQKAIDQQGVQMGKVAAANDNIAQSSDAAGKSLAANSEHFLKTVEHLKLLATAAYLVSPALREMVNEDIGKAIGLIEPKALAAAKAVSASLAPAIGVDLVQSFELSLPIIKAVGAAIYAAIVPILTFLGPVLLAITAITTAWKALHYVWEQGASLLQKYQDAQHALYADDVESNLKDLTKYQADTISADQVARATELGERLKIAKDTISQFFDVHLNVTSVALQLQAVWVGIVESIAGAVRGVNAMIAAIPDWLVTFVNALAAVNRLAAGASFPNSVNTPAAPSTQADSTQAALSAARGRLAALMGNKNIGTDGAPLGSSFATRFSQDIAALAGNDNQPDKYQTNAYDRAKQSIQDQIDLLKLEADGAGKTTQQYQELKVAHELNIAAMKAGIQPTDAMRAEWKNLADQIADYTIKARAAAALQNEQFRGATMFMSPADQAAANVAHQIDPADWQSHMHDLASETARFNSEMGQARDISLNFLQSFNNDIVNGTVNMNTLANAVKGLGTKLLDIAENQAINALFGGLTGGSGGLFGGLLGGLFGSTSSVSVGQFGHNAAGTDNWQGGPTWVGEQGPEVVNLPRGAQVIPNNRIGGMSVTVNNNASGVSIVPRQTSGGLTIDVVESVVDQKIGAFNKTLPDRVSAINRDPRLRGR